MNKDQRINDFANRSFRDVADQDYIAARQSYRAELWEPFLWLSLQAFEKYFKAILLFNRISSKGVGHDLEKAIDLIQEKTSINFNLPPEAKEFIVYLNTYGTNRYLEYSTHLDAHALMKLDGSIWHVRRFCFYMQSTTMTNTGEHISNLQANISNATSQEYGRNPHKYKIEGGLLEKILADNSEAAQFLVYHNAYYGRTKKMKIKNYKSKIICTNSTLSLYPEAFGELEGLVQFSRMVSNYYKNLTT